LSLKRRIYGLPFFRPYREFRSGRIAAHPVETAHGFRFAGDPIYLDPSWEREELELILRLLPRIGAFIDVGANHGIYCCHVAQRGTPVAAIEPEDGNLRILKANLSQFDQAEVFPIAVSDRPGIFDLYGDGDTASLHPDWVGTSKTFRQLVATNTLDNLFAHRWRGTRLFIKIDVEGAEEQVLAGAAELLLRNPKPYWLIEAFPGASRDRLFETLRSAGYDLHAVQWFNFLCTDDPEVQTEPVSSMRFGRPDISFELTFDPPVTSWEAMERVVEHARAMGQSFD
jgi:FkbM family methyltransferase